MSDLNKKDSSEDLWSHLLPQMRKADQAKREGSVQVPVGFATRVVTLAAEKRASSDTILETLRLWRMWLLSGAGAVAILTLLMSVNTLRQEPQSLFFPVPAFDVPQFNEKKSL